MAYVKVEEVIDHLSSEMRRALQDAVNQVAPDANFDVYGLFREFRRAVGRKCDTWEHVPDHLVKED